MATKKPAPTDTAPAAPQDVTTFPLTLAGKPVVLEVTPTALMKAGRPYGGLLPLFERLKAWDLDTFAYVVTICTGGSEVDIRKTQTAVAASDLAEVFGACVGAVSRMINGAPKQTTDKAA